MNFSHGSNINGCPSSGVPSRRSPSLWAMHVSMNRMINSASWILKSQAGFSRSFENRSHAARNGLQAFFFPLIMLFT